MATPVSRANPTAGPDRAGLRASQIPTRSRPTPAAAVGSSRSPSTGTPTATAKSGAVPRRDGVDGRELAPPIRRREEHEVEELNDGRRAREDPRLEAQRGCPAEPPPGGHERGGHNETPGDPPGGRGQWILGGLEEHVPQRVEDRRDREQDDDEGRHRRGAYGARARAGARGRRR